MSPSKQPALNQQSPSKKGCKDAGSEQDRSWLYTRYHYIITLLRYRYYLHVIIHAVLLDPAHTLH